MNDIVSRRPVIDVDFSEEQWEEREPVMGDHIRVKRIGGLYAHHGVYVSDDEVIHFTGTEDDSILDWSKAEVISSDLSFFLKSGTLEVKEYTDEEYQDLYSPEQIVSYARACIGDAGYNLGFNNCEHFANVCTLGRFRSNQVERVLSGKLPNEEDKNMRLFGWIGEGIKKIFGGGSGSDSGRSRSTTTYEPDKVKVAEIESDTKIRLANMENERIELMKRVRLDILQSETESQIALEEARAQGMTVMAQTIVAMQEKMNEIAEKRLNIIEHGSLQIVREIENFYSELNTKIEKDNDIYNTEKLPKLLTILEKYENGTPAHTLYMKRIEEDMALQGKHYITQLEAVSNRQEKIIDSFIANKNRIIEQTEQIAGDMLKTAQNQITALETGNMPERDTRILADTSRLALGEGE